MDLKKPPHFEHNVVFVQKVLPMSFWYDEHRGQVISMAPHPFHTLFEELPIMGQEDVINSLGFDPEKLGVQSIGKIVGFVRVGLAWLEKHPDKDVIDVENLILFGEQGED